MKLNVENIIYIIVIIVWVVVGFIKKSKKKESRPTSSMPPVGEPQQPDISDVLEKIFGEKPTVQKETIPAPVVLKKNEPKVKSFDIRSLETITGTDSTQRSIKKNLQFGKAYKDRKPVVVPGIKHDMESPAIAEEKQTTLDHIIQGQFDLRKAVILSEILNPPYVHS